MEPDSGPVHRRDTIGRAHLRDPHDASHVMYRYETTGPLAALVQRTWIPVWSVPPGQESVQRVLQYPVCLVVVTPEYARFYGVVSGLSTTTLTGEGWAVGVMLTPAAGALVAGGPVSAYTDRAVDVAEVLGDDGARLTARVRAAMAGDPHSPPRTRPRGRPTTTPCGGSCRSTRRGCSSTGWWRWSSHGRTSPGSTSCARGRGCPSARCSGWPRAGWG